MNRCSRLAELGACVTVASGETGSVVLSELSNVELWVRDLGVLLRVSVRFPSFSGGEADHEPLAKRTKNMSES